MCNLSNRLIEENRDHPEILNINCIDPLNRSALIAAIENENIELIKLLLELGIEVKVISWNRNGAVFLMKIMCPPYLLLVLWLSRWYTIIDVYRDTVITIPYISGTFEVTMYSFSQKVQFRLSTYWQSFYHVWNDINRYKWRCY